MGRDGQKLWKRYRSGSQKFRARRGDQDLNLGTPWWYKTSILLGIHRYPTRIKSAGDTKNSLQQFLPPSARPERNCTDYPQEWNPRKQHLTDLKQTRWQKQVSEESRKERHLFRCIVVCQTDTTADIGTFKIPWPMDEHSLANDSTYLQTHLPERQSSSPSVWQQDDVGHIHGHALHTGF